MRSGDLTQSEIAKIPISAVCGCPGSIYWSGEITNPFEFPIHIQEVQLETHDKNGVLTHRESSDHVTVSSGDGIIRPHEQQHFSTNWFWSDEVNAFKIVSVTIGSYAEQK
jgi:hypothetical protein